MVKKSRNMMLAILTLALTLIALSSTTLAWFNLSKTVAVGSIEGEVMVSEGLEVAMGINGTNITGFKAKLTANDFNEVMDEIPEFVIIPVSTIDGNDFQRLIYQSGGLVQSNAYKNVDYLELDIYFRSKTSGKIFFNKYEFTSEGVLFEPKVRYAKTGNEITEVAPFMAYAKDALRISVDGNIYQARESITNTHTSNRGVYYGQYSYVTQMSNDIYWGNRQTGLVEKVTEETITNVEIADAMTSLVGDLEISNLIYNEQTDYFESNFKIKVWLEGFDADGYDAIQGSEIGLILSFRKKEI